MAQRDFIRRKISKQQYQEIWYKLNNTEPHPITDIEFNEMQRILFEDDWVRPLSEEEYCDRFQRVSGNTICWICGFTYYDHPYETRVSTYDNQHRLCDGRLGHT